MIDKIFRNIKVKIVVTSFAIFLWFFVETENNYTYSFKIPIKTINKDQGKIITNELPRNAKVTFWGRGRELLTLKLSQKLSYFIDLTNVDESTNFVLNEKNIRLPSVSTIEVINIIEPESVFVEIKDIDEKNVPIKSNVNILTLPGYTIVNEIQFLPDSILITGPNPQIDSVKFIETEKLVFKKIKRDLTKKIELIPPKIKYVDIKIKEINLFADVQKLMEKPLVDIPIYIINKPEGMEFIIVPSSVDLTLVGGVDQLLPITKNDIFAYIDYEKIKNSKQDTYLAYIDKPPGIQITDVKTERFKVKTRKVR